jgi:hypothetical protein
MPALLLASVVALTQDVGRVANYFAGKGKAFASVELLGWTAENALVYRATVCDDNKLGERGAYCTIDVCTIAAGAEPDCEAVIDDEPGSKVDRKAGVAAVTAAQDKRAINDTGTRTSAKLDRAHDDIWIEAKELPVARPDHKRTWISVGDSRDYSRFVVRGARKSHDGTCIAIAGTAVNTVHWVREYGGDAKHPFAFAVIRCK